MLSAITGTKRFKALQADIANLRAHLSDASRRIDTLSEALHQRTERLEQELATARERAAGAEESLATLRAQHERLQEQAQHMSEESQRGREALHDADARIDRLEADRDKRDMTLAKLQRQMEVQADDLRGAVAGLIGRTEADRPSTPAVAAD